MLGRCFPPNTKEKQQLRMIKLCDPAESELSPFLITLTLAVLLAEYLTGIMANGFITAVHAAEWVQNKSVSTSGRILVFLSVSRIALQSLMMLEISISSTSLSFYSEDSVYYAFKISFIFLNFCRLWFAAWLSFFYFVKTANFSYPLFLKLRWRISGLIPWLLWLSVFISFSHSMFCINICTGYCDNSFPIHSSNSTEKTYFSAISVVSLAFLFNLGIVIPLIMFILAAILLILSLKRHTLHMGSNATGSKDPSMEAHIGAIKATSYFLILYIFNAVALFIYLSNMFDINSLWNTLCQIIMAAYPASHSTLLIKDNPGLRRAWKQLQHRLHLYPKEWTL
ncbi:taste receptor type 2 member 39 [Chlorocebus sabaeus]|uniref:taste receptor type 2 member 39 n=1 Tax=Chlorocebus sabaeus TaxID=60711 RepID=UPI003BF9D6E1